MINLVFEDLPNFKNFVECKDINGSGISRFSPSASMGKLIRKNQVNVFDKKNKPNHFIISTGVNHHPNDWTGSEFVNGNTRSSCFSYISEEYYRYIRKRKAMIMFDQTLEGYQTPWLWEYFHNECDKFLVNPSAIIYLTGNLLAEKQYDIWANERNITNRINVISFPLFESDVYEISKEMNLADSFDYYYQYKKDNQTSIKLFNCLQKRLRAHRMWIYQEFFESNLLSNSIFSMNPFDYRSSFFEGKRLEETKTIESNKLLPLLINGKNNNEYDDNYYIRRITDNVYMNSWVSVISEASFADSDDTLFLSEKTFKPISCFHPFIIAGNRNSLSKIRELGYKTFHGFIDESYDDLSTFERLKQIVNSVKKINQIEDKLSWYESMKDILIHNYQTFKKNSISNNNFYERLQFCYDRYFEKL